jgi:4-amino-4-deoxy-L-arabinose transferase-like glycosyltransferase
MTAVTSALPLAVKPARSDSALLACLLVFHFFLWWLVPTLFAWTVPTDNCEQLVFSQELAWSYPKHPPLPTWVLYGFIELVGPSVGLTYFLGAACGTLTLAIVYQLAKEFVSPERAVLAAMLSTLIIYHGYLTTSFNHNTLQLPVAAATVAVLHVALKRRHWKFWAALGGVAALNMLTKYSAVLQLGCCGLYLLASGHLREREVRRGILIAVSVFALAIAPHAIDVFRNDGQTIQYAAAMLSVGSLGIGGRFETIWNFLSAQAGRLAPPLIALALVQRWAAKKGVAPRPCSAPSVDTQLLVWIVGFGPLVLTVLFSAVAGARLLTGWGTTFFILFSLWLVTHERFRFEPTPHFLRGMFVAAVAIELLVAGAVAWGGGKFPNPLKHLVQASLPPSDLALQTNRVWNRYADRPPCAIASDVVTGGILVTGIRGQVQVLDENASLRRWLGQHSCIERGALILLREAPTAANILGLPAGVRDEVAGADVFDTVQLRRHGHEVIYYAAIILPHRTAVP